MDMGNQDDMDGQRWSDEVASEQPETWVRFDEAFEAVINVELGEPTNDPRNELSPQQRQAYVEALRDVQRAQRYAETLGSVPRR